MSVLRAFREQLYHRCRWRTVCRDELGEIQVCECGAARRRPDEPDEPDEPDKSVNAIPWPRAGKEHFLDLRAEIDLTR